jgi:hypothetical protein
LEVIEKKGGAKGTDNLYPHMGRMLSAGMAADLSKLPSRLVVNRVKNHTE